MIKKILSVNITIIVTLVGFLMFNSVWAANKHVVEQKNKEFVLTGKIVSGKMIKTKDGKTLERLVIEPGDAVEFKNSDEFFHNIYSLNESKPFDLGSYPKGESRTVKFDKKGTYEVECAIHPNMYLEVVVKPGKK